jgi:hypothetical protein
MSVAQVLPFREAVAKYKTLVGKGVGRFLGAQDAKTLFAEEENAGISYYDLGNQYTLAGLSDEEIIRILYFVRNTASLMQRADPYLADLYLKHESLIVKFAAIAKARFARDQPIAYPAQPSTIGIAPLVPQVLQSTLNTGGVAWASDGTWDVNLTAGPTPNYLIGTTDFFRTSNTFDKQLYILIFQNGIIEVGSTPAIDQMWLISETKSQYAPWSVYPLVSEANLLGKSIYIYNTLGFFDLSPTLGVRLAVRPVYNRSPANIRLVGVAYFEYLFWRTTGASPSPFI